MITPAALATGPLPSKMEIAPKNTSTAAINPSTNVGCFWSQV